MLCFWSAMLRPRGQSLGLPGWNRQGAGRAGCSRCRFVSPASASGERTTANRSSRPARAAGGDPGRTDPRPRVAETAALRAAEPPRRAVGRLAEDVDPAGRDETLGNTDETALVDLDVEVLNRLLDVAAFGCNEVRERERAGAVAITRCADDAVHRRGGERPADDRVGQRADRVLILSVEDRAAQLRLERSRNGWAANALQCVDAHLAELAVEHNARLLRQTHEHGAAE